MRKEMEQLIDKMLNGRILLGEAMLEFEKVYIEKSLKRNANHLCRTADELGIHRNTLSKRLASYEAPKRKSKPLRKSNGRK